jgi:hypothetical protein
VKRSDETLIFLIAVAIASLYVAAWIYMVAFP